jgi:protoporphyrinogen oxidase
MSAQPNILIIGAGPTGLGAAWRLHELGHRAWKLIDASPVPGGLAASFVDEHGFTWDMGGHVLFSHYEYFDHLMDELLGDAWVQHEREAWVWMRERFIPYPLQNNIWRLPAEDLIPCLNGLLQVHGARSPEESPANFHDWILSSFGQGLADVFLLPYNRKVWAYDPHLLNADWMGERVARVNLSRILENLVLRRDHCSWGPNAKFRFPLRGGTGAIWRALYERLASRRIELGCRVAEIDTAAKEAITTDGRTCNYDYLISTMPLDVLLTMLTDRRDLAAHAASFRHSSTHVIGFGMEGPPPETLATKCWLYFPEVSVPFYRATVFSNYSPNNVPEPGRYWSLMCEVSESPDKPVNASTVAEESLAGARYARLIPVNAPVVSICHRRLPHGYPTPFLGRNRVLETVDPELRRMGIWSRGRFGAWKYEVSNQDHSLMQGVEAVDHIILGAEETTYRYPSVVNAGKGLGRRPMQPLLESAARERKKHALA